MTIAAMAYSSCQTPRQALTKLALALSIIALIDGCSKAPPPPTAKPPTEVTTITIAPRDTPVSMEYAAQTQSSYQVNIQARVSGFLEKRVYKEGEPVKAGQVLFLMDKKPFQVQLEGAQAVLLRQQAAMETARANLARVKPLAEQNALSQKDLDDATGQYEAAAAAVEQARASVETAKLNLSYCTITSPLDGITSAAIQQDGAYINLSNSLLTTVSAMTPMWVNFSLSENEVQNFRTQVNKGLLNPPANNDYVVEVIQADGSLFPHTGHITFAAPEYNAQTGTFLLRVSVDNPKALLRPNQFVRVRLNGAIRPNAILVPQRAVLKGAKGHFVIVVDKENKAQIRSVEVGPWQGEDWFINQGLAAGDVVVVEGMMRLSPGAPVKIAKIVDAAAKAPVAETTPAAAGSTGEAKK
jgi:membrane fusion protein, multidrug efflux system